MKRDWDLIREVLLEIEALDTHTRDEKEYAVSRGQPAESDAKAEHAFMLRDGGYITGINADSDDGPVLRAPQLTRAGLELLDTMRSKPVWERIRALAAEKGVELTLDAVKALGKLALAIES